MRAAQFIDDYIDGDVITDKFRRELDDAMLRQGPNKNPELIQALYGNEREDIELAQLRADLLKTQAEAEELAASAEKDRADAQRVRTGRRTPRDR